MTMKTKKELFGIEIKGYFNNSKIEKGRILDALERQTGMRRESIIRCFKREWNRSAYNQPGKRGRETYYTQDVYFALKEIWESANSCCGELLHPVIAEYVNILKRDKMWKHGDEATFQGSWLEVPVGMGQIDTVAHCGGSLIGDFVYSCGYVDVSSGWFEYRAQWNKGMEETRRSLEAIRRRLYFSLLQVHPDCGTEFLNKLVMSWCKDENINISRSRSYHKNDNGYIEQRNGHISRRWLGYERLGSKELLPKLNQFYELICDYHNHFIAQRLCIGTKTLPNGKHRKMYEKIAQTPYSRLLANPNISQNIKEKLTKNHRKMNPKILHDKLEKMKCDILKTNRLATGRDHFTNI